MKDVLSNRNESGSSGFSKFLSTMALVVALTTLPIEKTQAQTINAVTQNQINSLKQHYKPQHVTIDSIINVVQNEETKQYLRLVNETHKTLFFDIFQYLERNGYSAYRDSAWYREEIQGLDEICEYAKQTISNK